MTVLTERHLQMTINHAISARKFDHADHGLSHCMKAVDFVVELAHRYWFIEFKDPQAVRTNEKEYEAFRQRLQSDRLDMNLVYKCRDSFLYEWAAKRADKPIDYWVLIALDDMDSSHLLTRKEALERKLPLRGPSSHPWPRPIVRGCGVFTIASWNRHFPKCPVKRLP